MDLGVKDFKSNVLSMLTELKETTDKELKETSEITNTEHRQRNRERKERQRETLQKGTKEKFWN